MEAPKDLKFGFGIVGFVVRRPYGLSLLGRRFDYKEVKRLHSFLGKVLVYLEWATVNEPDE